MIHKLTACERSLLYKVVKDQQSVMKSTPPPDSFQTLDCYIEYLHKAAWDYQSLIRLLCRVMSQEFSTVEESDWTKAQDMLRALGCTSKAALDANSWST